MIGAGLASALWTLNSHGVLGITSHQIAPQVRAMEKHHGDVWCYVFPASKGVPNSSLAIKRSARKIQMDFFAGVYHGCARTLVSEGQ